MFALLLALGFFATLAFYNFYHKRKNLPPGPTPLPLLGNLVSLVRDAPGERCLMRWRRQYGAVFTYWMGEVPIVAVAELETMLDTFQRDGDAYAGRTAFEEFETLTKGLCVCFLLNPFFGGVFGVIMTEGDLWREHRRFALHLFRELGVGRNVMQERILDEFATMSRRIDATLATAAPDDELNLVHAFIEPAVGSVINSILFGYRFDDDRLDEFFALKAALTWLMKIGERYAMLPLVLMPNLLARMPVFRTAFGEYMANLTLLGDFFQRQIETHRLTAAKDDDDEAEEDDAAPSDYVEAYLRNQAKLERRRRNENGGGERSDGEHSFTDAQLKAMCFDLWSAGQETSSTTLAWGVAFLLHHPDVVARACAELDEVVGDAGDRRSPRRLVTIADRAKLHYMNAVVNEVQRCANLISQNLLHKLTRDVVLDGFHLKKGTTVVPQISVLHIDDKHFPEPWAFRPQRFLHADGTLKRCDALLPFGLGKRQCLGEPLARYEIFLFLANLLWKYEILPGKRMPSMERGGFGFVLCDEFKCRLKKRD